MAKREHKIRELSLFQLGNQTFVLILREFASVIIKNSFRGLGRGGVKENDCRRVLPEGSCYAGHLLSQLPNTSGASKYERDQQELQKNKKSSKRSDTRIHRKKKIKIKWMK